MIHRRYTQNTIIIIIVINWFKFRFSSTPSCDGLFCHRHRSGRRGILPWIFLPAKIDLIHIFVVVCLLCVFAWLPRLIFVLSRCIRFSFTTDLNYGTTGPIDRPRDVNRIEKAWEKYEFRYFCHRMKLKIEWKADDARTRPRQFTKFLIRENKKPQIATRTPHRQPEAKLSISHPKIYLQYISTRMRVKNKFEEFLRSLLRPVSVRCVCAFIGDRGRRFCFRSLILLNFTSV